MPRTLTEQIEQTIDDIADDLDEDFKPRQLNLTGIIWPTKKDKANAKTMSIDDALAISAMRQSTGESK